MDTSVLTGAPAASVTPNSTNTNPDPTFGGNLPVNSGSAGPSVTPMPAPAPSTSPWRSILQGALWGLSNVSQQRGRGNFAEGLAQGDEGAIAGEQKQEQVQSNIRFQSAQAANLVAEAAYRNKQLSRLDQEYEDQHNQNSLATMKDLQTMGIPFQVVGRSNDDVSAFLKANGQNGLAPYSVLHIGDSFVAVNLNQAAQGPALLSTVNHMQQASGMRQTTPAEWAQLPQQSKNELVDDSLHYFNPVVTSQEQLSDVHNRIATLEAQPDYDGKDKDLAQLKRIEGFGQSEIDRSNKAKADQLASQTKQQTQARLDVENSPANTAASASKAATVAGAEENARQNASNKPGYAVTPDGKTVQTTFGQAQANGFSGFREVKEADINKDQHDIKVLNDIQVKSDAVQKTAAAMDQNSWAQAAGVAKYLADNPNTTVQALEKSQVMQNISPQAQQYVIAVNSLRESAMGLQKVLTGSSRNNEAQINALLSTLPGYEPNSGIVSQKLSAFNQNLGMLAQGLPENTGVPIQVHGSPKIGDTKTFPNGKIGKWDGQGWVAQ